MRRITDDLMSLAQEADRALQQIGEITHLLNEAGVPDAEEVSPTEGRSLSVVERVQCLLAAYAYRTAAETRSVGSNHE